jgi:hypothetical protein
MIKNLSFLTAAIFGLSSFLVAQTRTENNVKQSLSRIDATNRSINLPASYSPLNSASSADSSEQKPVTLGKSGISTFIGYDVRATYQSNPGGDSGKLYKNTTGVWTNTFYGGADFGEFDFANTVVIPVVGGSWTSNEFTKTHFEDYDYYSTEAYAILLAEYSDNWTARLGIGYASDISVKYSTEDYSGIYPTVGISKVYTVNSETDALFDFSITKHYASSITHLIKDEGHTGDQLTNWDATLSYGLRHEYAGFTISPTLTTSYKIYEEDLNKDRDDFSYGGSILVEYPLVSDVQASVLASYGNRDSSGTTANHDYKSWDGSIGINVSTSF